MKIFRKLFLLATLVMVGVLSANSQNSMTPYSMYGYGLLNDNATSMQRQMGGVGYAMNSGRQINVMNPASYASIDTLTFLWDMGATVSMLWSQEGSAKEKSVGGGLDYITMQFPLGKYMGGSAGLLPYSSVGYAFGNEIKHGTLSNQGSGGINQAYVGVSGRIGNFSVGANFSYNFGSIVNDVYANAESGSQTLFEQVLQVRDWNVNIGAQYSLQWNKQNRLTFGATYSPKKTMRGKTWATYWDINQDAAADTVGYMDMKNKYYQPNTIGVGINYQYERSYKVMVEADFTWQDWSKAKFSPLYDEDNTVVFQGMTFDDRWKAAVGAEYVPKLRGNYLQRINYRIGGYYTHDYLLIHGNNVREYGITAGFGVPTIEGKTMINIGFEWKHRSAHPDKLISENYFNITLGINFNELWFWQRKLK